MKKNPLSWFPVCTPFPSPTEHGTIQQAEEMRLTFTKGKAPAWTPPATIQKLKEDGGNYFRDKNAARYPAHPIQPAVEAIFASQPNFPAASVHVFACSSTLGNLLRFVRGVNKPFRILVEVVGDTVFFVRRENSPTELIPDVRGYGHSFPEAYTTWEAEVKGSVSHQRIIRYKFGGLNCVVRFEADGYLKDLVSGISKPNGPLDRPKPETCNDVLTSALKKSAITERSSAPDTPLTIIHGGQQIPRTAIFDLKTRSIRKRDQDTLGEELPRLWVAQLNNFISAYHTSGVFKEIQIQNVHREVDDWERDNEDIVRRLAVLLRKIVAFAHGRRDEKLELRSQEVNVLELREQTKEAGQALPVALENRWLNRESGKSDSPRTQLEGQDYGGGSEPDDENGPLDWDEGSEKDFTACSAEDCGYCGHCSY